MKNFLYALLTVAASTTAIQAGGLAPVVVEDVPVVEEKPASSVSPLLIIGLLILIGVLIKRNDDDSSTAQPPGP